TYFPHLALEFVCCMKEDVVWERGILTDLLRSSSIADGWESFAPTMLPTHSTTSSGSGPALGRENIGVPMQSAKAHWTIWSRRSRHEHISSPLQKAPVCCTG